MRPALLLLLAAAATSRARLRAPRFPRHDGDADIFVKLTAGDDRRYDSVYADDGSDGAPRRRARERVARAAEVLRAWLERKRLAFNLTYAALRDVDSLQVALAAPTPLAWAAPHATTCFTPCFAPASHLLHTLLHTSVCPTLRPSADCP